MCVDYMDLNKAFPKDHYPLPSIVQLIDATAGYQECGPFTDVASDVALQALRLLFWCCSRLISVALAKGVYITGTSLIGVAINALGMDFGNNLDEMFKFMGRKWESCEGRPNAEAQKFYRRVEEGKQPLFPGCTNFSRLGFMIRLYYLKCVHGISESAFGELLKLMKEVFPEAHLPLSFNAAKNVIKDLGLHYEKIHTCPNSCMLYWAENKDKDECHTCGVSRWVVEEKGSGVNNEPEKLIHKVPTNVMKYFPLKPRLKRMFMCKEFSKIMTWYAVGCKKDGKLRHLDDGEAWKMMDAQYPDFSSEHRNVNLGVSADGLCPYRTMNLTHSTWPIMLVNYNSLFVTIYHEKNIKVGACVTVDQTGHISQGMDDTIVNVRELVKDNLHFTEIIGIYANKGRKGGWQLLSNDKQVMALVEDCAPGYLVNFYIDNIVDKQIEPAPQI
ncbi:hypothetical protein AgCh_039725 [Apium graveolens]